jgi:ABC-2 type transport system ATP-binding protein
MAVIHNPRVLFLDEPFEGIDPASSRNIKDLLLLMSAKGATVFLTSHILEVVEHLVDGFAIIVRGAIVRSQTIEQARRSHRSLEDIYFEHVERRPVVEFEWIGSR